jgi:hypothetical protein
MILPERLNTFQLTYIIWLPMKEKMSLDKTFRALHDTHQTYVGVNLPLRVFPAGADQIRSIIKAEYTNRTGAGFWAFWEENRLKANLTRHQLAIPLWNLWRLI